MRTTVQKQARRRVSDPRCEQLGETNQRGATTPPKTKETQTAEPSIRRARTLRNCSHARLSIVKPQRPKRPASICLAKADNPHTRAGASRSLCRVARGLRRQRKQSDKSNPRLQQFLDRGHHTTPGNNRDAPAISGKTSKKQKNGGLPFGHNGQPTALSHQTRGAARFISALAGSRWLSAKEARMGVR